MFFFLFSIIYFFLQNSLIRGSVKSFVTIENFFLKSRNFYNLQILMKTIAMTDSGGGAVGQSVSPASGKLGGRIPAATDLIVKTGSDNSTA